MAKRDGMAGRAVRPAKNGKTQVARTGGARWSGAAEDRFIEELAATCNVSAAAAVAGFSTTAIYKRRLKEPAFAERWAAAQAQGYADLELLMVEAAKSAIGGGPPGEAEAAGAMREKAVAGALSVGDALNLLKLHRASCKGGAPQRYAQPALPDIETVRAEVLRKLAAIERAGARSVAARASGKGEREGG